MQPLNRSSIVFFISTGSAQSFVGPASSLVFEQMNVRSSTRATSLGCDRARYEPGRNFSFSLMNVPCSTIRSHKAWFSASEPSHQWTAAGSQRLVISRTQAARFWLAVTEWFVWVFDIIYFRV